MLNFIVKRWLAACGADDLEHAVYAPQTFHGVCEVRPTSDLQLQIDKGKFDVFILCCNALDIQTHGTQARCQDSNHASTVLNLNTQANRVRPLYDIIPV